MKIKIAYANENAEDSSNAQNIIEYIRKHCKIKRVKKVDRGATHKNIYIETPEN